MEPISNRQLEELREVLARHKVSYLFIGKGAALLHGFPDTTQDADLFVRKTPENNRAIVRALRDLKFDITEEQRHEIERGKDFVQIKNGQFDVDLIFAPDGIENFNEAWQRGREINDYPVCSLDDIIASKRAANRQKDRESLTRLESYRQYLRSQPPKGQPLPKLPQDDPAAVRKQAETASAELYDDLDQCLEPLATAMFGALSNTGPVLNTAIKLRPWWRNEQSRTAICRSLQAHLKPFAENPDIEQTRKHLAGQRELILSALHRAAWPHTPEGVYAAEFGITPSPPVPRTPNTPTRGTSISQ